MTGIEIVNYILDNNLQSREFFVAAEGYLGETSLDSICETNSGDVILGFTEMVNGSFPDKRILETYFSRWFQIISKEEAERFWEEGNRSFSVLHQDTSDCYASCYQSFEEANEYAAFFGTEKAV